MKLPNNYRGKLSGACGNDSYNPKLSQPYLDVESKLVIATDGHILCSIPIEVEDGEKSGPIPREALEKLVSGSKRDAKLHCGDNVVLRYKDGETTTYPRKDHSFVDYRSAAGKNTAKGAPTITLNAGLLKRIAEGLDSDEGVHLWVSKPDEPILIATFKYGSTSMGILMPMRVTREVGVPAFPKTDPEPSAKPAKKRTKAA